MLGNVFLKTFRDRWVGWLIAAVSLWSMVLLGMVAYQSIDVEIFQSMPEVYRSIIGLREGMDGGALAVNAIYGSYGMMTLASMALAMGAAAIAGEEGRGTLGLLLANPVSRTKVLVSKAAAMLLLAALSTAALWGSIVVTARVVDIRLGGLDVPALSVHVVVSVIFYGMVALAVGAATGRRGSALSASIGLMVAGFLGAGVLPMVEWGEDLVEILPWYYFNGSDPIYNGVEWSHVGILTGASALLCAVAIVGFARRDLRSFEGGKGLLERLLAHPRAARVFERLTSAVRVSSIWAKTASEYQTMMLICAAYMFGFQGLMLGPFYAAIPENVRAAAGALPETLLAFFGGGSASTPEGWYRLETFGMMAPLVAMVVTIAIGAGALAGEEERRTMGLLLAAPVARTRVIAGKTATMFLYGLAVGVATFAGVWAGSLAADLGMDAANIAAASALSTLVAFDFGALALALGAATGRHKVAVWGAVGAALAFHILNALGEVVDSISGLQKLSPFYYYLSGDPLVNGMDWGHAAVHVGIVAVLLVASVAMFQRRDIRQQG